MDLDAEQSLRDDELRMVFMCLPSKACPGCAGSAKPETCWRIQYGGDRPHLLSEPTTIAQRLVRAKRLIREQKLALTMPSKGQLKQRVNSVLKVIYLMFSGAMLHILGKTSSVSMSAWKRCGWEGWLRPLRWALRGGCPVALMALQAARLPARTDAAGDLVLLEEQDRNLWDE